MQDPKKEISDIIHTLRTTRVANDLEKTVEKYFSPDATFSHPMCKANSRNEILGLFQWYRLASPETQVKVVSVIYDVELNVLVVEVEEKLNIWFNPFPSKAGRMIVRLKLRKNNGVHCIVSEECLTHPMDQIGLLASPLVPLAASCLRFGCVFSNLGACVLGNVGLNKGLQGGGISYAGLLEAVGLAGKTGDKSNGRALKEKN